MNRTDNKLYVLLWLALHLAMGTNAQTPQPIPGTLIVQLENGERPTHLLSKARSSSRTVLQHRPLNHKQNIHLLTFDPATDLEELLEEVRHWPGIAQVQLDYQLSERNTPNDPYYDRQWTFERIGLPQAWDITTGGLTAAGDTIVVAVTDAGFNARHLDIRTNLWYNLSEIPDDGIDNDQNGYIDDDQGWNFIEDNNRHPVSSHGHKVAGIIGAKGDNDFGVTGINWNVKLMLLSSSTISELIAAYEYMIEQRDRYNRTDGREGAFVVATNLSLGLSGTFCEDQPIWGEMYNRLGEVGILAGVATANENYDVERFGDMPTSCDSEYLLTVTNTTRNDEKYQLAAFGNISIDMGAPGEGSITLDVYDEYSVFGGNSAAAPHVTGAIALLYSLPCEYLAADALREPSQTALRIRQALLDGVDPLPSLAEKTVTGGRLNVFRSMQLLSQGCAASIGDLSILKLFPNPTTGTATVELQTPDYETYQLIVTNALGQIVYREDFEPLFLDPKRKSVRLPQLPSGVYQVSIGNSREWASELLVVH